MVSKFYLFLSVVFVCAFGAQALSQVQTTLDFNFAKTVPKIHNCPKGAPRLANDTLVEFKLGGLVDLQGLVNPDGAFVTLAFKIAARELNVFLKNLNAPFFINLMLEDTKSDPALALRQLQSLNGRGVNVVVGPSSSAEISAIQAYVAKQGSINVISPASSAVSLKQVDNIYRLFYIDDVTALATAQFIATKNITKVISLFRNDAYGQSFSSNFRTVLPSQIAFSQYSYESNVDPSQLLSSVNAEVVNGGGKVAILLVSFGEWTSILGAANVHPALKQATWFGPDLSAPNVWSPNAGAVAALGNVFSVSIKVPSSDLKDSLRASFSDLAATTVPPSAYFAYDAVYLAFFSFILPRVAENPRYKAALEYIADSLFLTTQRVSLNNFGDRYLDTEFDALRLQSSGTVVTASYDNGVWTPKKL